MQSYVGGYGAMVHPVGACATAAVSVEEGVDKIRLGKAELVVAGGFDDMTSDAITGFGDMAATADTEMMRDRGSATPASRAPTIVAGWASWRPRRRNDPARPRRPGAEDGSSGAGRGRLRAELRRRGARPSRPRAGCPRRRPRRPRLGPGPLLRRLGVQADDIAVISKHDTSTLANDPNETELHERLADAMGRSPGRRCSWCPRRP